MQRRSTSIRATVHLVVLSLLFSAAAAAAGGAGRRPAIAPPVVWKSGPAAPTAEKADTLDLYGGPGTLEGKFQDAAGLPDRQGWVGVDLTADTESHWQVSTFNAAALDPAQPDNHAWWCGDVFTACSPADSAAGYGNGWQQALDWRYPVDDPGQPVTVRVTARLSYESEPGYDFLYLKAISDTDPPGERVLQTWNGVGAALDVDETIVLQPADLDSGRVHLRWEFVSDAGFSDEDCYWPTDAGACQVDRIAVTFDQGDGPVAAGAVETCEPGDPLQWYPYTAPNGVGDFSQVWPLLDDINPCQQNDTPQFAFIDDGVVVPGTGGSACITWCYGPGGYVVNSTGGLLGPDAHLNNAIWSPAIAWPAGYDGGLLSFDVWRHLGFQGGIDSGHFFVWSVRFATDADATQWTAWRSSNFFYEGEAAYYRQEEELAALIEPGAQWVQISLGVFEAGDLFGLNGNDATPAPYLDNVRLQAYHLPAPATGPVMQTSGSRLARDAFPASGALDLSDPASLSARFDGGTDTRSDTLTVTIQHRRAGAAFTAPPRLYYTWRPNPVFDPYRTVTLPRSGSVAGTENGNIWSFDLPDSGAFFPGDVLHYYFRAEDAVDGADPVASILPADTTGFSLLPGDPGYVPGVYPADFTYRVLPSLRDLAGDQPDILLWYDNTDEPAAVAQWEAALEHVGVDADLFVNKSGFQAGSLGGQATPDQVAGYRTILYSNGRRSTDALVGFLSQFSPFPDARADLDLLLAWLGDGDRRLLMFGQQVVTDIEQDGLADTDLFLQQRLGVSPAGDDLVALTGVDRPVAVPVPDLQRDWPLHWRVMTGCLRADRVAAVVPLDPADRLAEFTDAAGEPGGWDYAAVARHVDPDGNLVYTVPYDLPAVTAPPAKGALTHAEALLAALLADAGELIAVGIDAPSLPDALALQAGPNPFNPRTELRYAMPRRGRLELALYDLAGRRVRMLVDGEVPAGTGRVTWDGADDAGRALPSGVYFAVARGAGRQVVEKVALVR